jgi:hypothetical protein
MEDFIRLNLNGFIGAMASLIVLFVAYFVIKSKIDKSYRKYAFLSLFSILGIFGFIVFFSLLSQSSVNVLPKSSIDRSFQTQSQDTYQSRVLENTKKESK